MTPMLPTEPPLSLHRLIAPVPPATAHENRTVKIAPQPRTPVVLVPAASNAVVAHSAQAKQLAHGPTMTGAAQDQTGNAAVAKAAMHTSPAVWAPFRTAHGPCACHGSGGVVPVSET